MQNKSTEQSSGPDRKESALHRSVFDDGRLDGIVQAEPADDQLDEEDDGNEYLRRDDECGLTLQTNHDDDGDGQQHRQDQKQPQQHDRLSASRTLREPKPAGL